MKRGLARESITLKSTSGKEIHFRAVRHGSFFLISVKQARRIPSGQGFGRYVTDHTFGRRIPVITDN